MLPPAGVGTNHSPMWGLHTQEPCHQIEWRLRRRRGAITKCATYQNVQTVRHSFNSGFMGGGARSAVFYDVCRNGDPKKSLFDSLIKNKKKKKKNVSINTFTFPLKLHFVLVILFNCCDHSG